MAGTLTLDEAGETLVGYAPRFHQALAQLPMLANTMETVLLTGETGTGKELVARAIHRLGPRANGPFLAVCCGSLVDDRVEPELFGHEPGASTDASTGPEGLLSHAAGGTLFLDGAEMLTPRAQVTLLRVLQDRMFRRVGSAREQRADVRFLAATNVRLEPLLESGRFRSDLFYRLSVFTVAMPPLRERREDILPLADHFLERYARPSAAPARLTPAAIEALLAHDWPGNVRELECAIVRAVHLTTGAAIDACDLGLAVAGGARAACEPAQSYKAQKRRIMDAFERQYLMRLMTEHRGNVTHAAITAGKERRDLGKLLKRHGIDPRQFVPSRH